MKMYNCNSHQLTVYLTLRTEYIVTVYITLVCVPLNESDDSDTKGLSLLIVRIVYIFENWEDCVHILG